MLALDATPGDTVSLSAAGSNDPDGDALSITWWIYREAGTFQGDLALSATRGPEARLVVPALPAGTPTPATAHVILQVQDQGTPSLVAYRRAILHLRP